MRNSGYLWLDPLVSRPDWLVEMLLTKEGERFSDRFSGSSVFAAQSGLQSYNGLCRPTSNWDAERSLHGPLKTKLTQ